MRAVAALAAACCVAAAGCSGQRATPAAQAAASAPATEAFEYRRIVMGAECRLVLHAASQSTADAAARAAFERLAAIEESLSDWMPSSEVRSLPTEPGREVSVSPVLAEALVASIEVSRASDGAFDPAIGALTKLWRAARRDGRVPSDAEQDACRARSGIDAVRFDARAATYAVTRPGIELDFGGIGQGIGADAALAVVREAGIASALVDLSGDIAVSAPPPGRSAWRIELDDPRRTVLELSDAAVTTSGDRFQHLDAPDAATGGTRRLSHILDPRTGRPLSTRTEVTVLAPTATEADAWATALSVLGPERGSEVLRARPRLAARWRREEIQPGGTGRISESITRGPESPRFP
jgi:thiamine biosynthesis lipoprotein